MDEKNNNADWDMDKYIIEANYDTDNIIAIIRKPDAKNRYMFFHYMPIDISEEPVVDVQYISSELLHKFVALYEQFNEDHGECKETPLDFIDSDEWADNSETVYHCDGYEDICDALSDNALFLTFMKEYVCKEYKFEEDLKEYIARQHEDHYDVGKAIFAAEQLGFKDLAKETIKKGANTVNEKNDYAAWEYEKASELDNNTLKNYIWQLDNNMSVPYAITTDLAFRDVLWNRGELPYGYHEKRLPKEVYDRYVPVDFRNKYLLAVDEFDEKTGQTTTTSIEQLFVKDHGWVDNEEYDELVETSGVDATSFYNENVTHISAHYIDADGKPSTGDMPVNVYRLMCDRTYDPINKEEYDRYKEKYAEWLQTREKENLGVPGVTAEYKGFNINYIDHMDSYHVSDKKGKTVAYTETLDEAKEGIDEYHKKESTNTTEIMYNHAPHITIPGTELSKIPSDIVAGIDLDKASVSMDMFDQICAELTYNNNPEFISTLYNTCFSDIEWIDKDKWQDNLTANLVIKEDEMIQGQERLLFSAHIERFFNSENIPHASINSDNVETIFGTELIERLKSAYNKQHNEMPDMTEPSKGAKL